MQRHVVYSYIYFTMISITMSAVSVSFVIPFAVDGIRKQRFIVPKWVSILQYVSATSLSIVMIFILSFASWAAPDLAFGEENLYMHIICPALILVCYLQIENGHKLTMKEIIFGAFPFYIYIIVYVIEVAVIGEKNGGWPDIYQIMDHMSPIAAVPLLLAFGFGISILVAAVSNLLTRKSKAKMFRYWKDDADPIEVRIEAYGLGVMMGQNMEKNNISIPLDILEYLADKYGIATEELVKAYIKGFMLGLNEKSK